MRPFQFIDHTGDLGVVVYGTSFPKFFQHAAEAFFHSLTDPKTIRETESRNIFLTAHKSEELLVAWLNEFIYLFETQNLLFRRFDIGQLTEQKLKATVWGEVYEEKRHPIKTLFKAVTFHQLHIVKEKGVWKAQIIFDI